MRNYGHVFNKHGFPTLHVQLPQGIDHPSILTPCALNSSRKPLITKGRFPRMSVPVQVPGNLTVFEFYDFLRADVLRFSDFSSRSRDFGLCTLLTGSVGRPDWLGQWHIRLHSLRAGDLEDNHTVCWSQPSLMVFKGLPMVWQINTILMDVSVCSTNTAEHVFQIFPPSFPMHVVFKLFFFSFLA